MKRITKEQAYYIIITLIMLGLIVSKYVQYGCVILCEDWYD
jgi:hypothetical protein